MTKCVKCGGMVFLVDSVGIDRYNTETGDIESTGTEFDENGNAFCENCETQISITDLENEGVLK